MLTYNKKLNVRTSVKFDIMIFIVILILTYLLAYKLTDYAADFKTIQNESRIEIVFLSIFFVFLFIPMMHINQDKISKNENRTLATYRPLFKKDNKINYNFGKDYNNWFNDRFCLRQFLLDVHTKFTFNLTGKAQKGFIDKEGWMYANGNLQHAHLGRIDAKNYDALVQLDKYYKAHNIELYILLVPVREYVHIPLEKLYIKDDHDLEIDKKITELNKQYDMHIVHPLKSLKEGSKNNYMFFKTEHHWTPDGAYIGYKELMKEINKYHDDIYTLQESDFNYSENCLVNADWAQTYNYGGYSGFLNLSENGKKKFHKTKYRYYKHKDSDLLKIKIQDIPYHKNKNFYFPKGADYRVLLLGTSQSEQLSNFISFTFKNVLRLRINTVKNVPVSDEFKIMKYYENEILDYKPDIIILCIGYSNLFSTHKIFNME